MCEISRARRENIKSVKSLALNYANILGVEPFHHDRFCATGMRSSVLNAVTNRLAGIVRLHNGRRFADRSGPPPTPELVLFEYEASPYCRRVRETLCVLELQALIKPCPRETLQLEGAYSAEAKHKPEVHREHKGRLLFPFLVDKTAGISLNESGAIVDHLWRLYSDNVIERPFVDKLLNGGSLPRPIDFALLAGPSGLRPWPSAGLLLAPGSSTASAPLVLSGNEHDQGTRLVRERLCELQLPYFSIPVESASQRPLPHLKDPTAGFACFGAAQALRHLDETYRSRPTLGYAAPVPVPNLGDPDRTSWLTHVVSRLPKWL